MSFREARELSVKKGLIEVQVQPQTRFETFSAGGSRERGPSKSIFSRKWDGRSIQGRSSVQRVCGCFDLVYSTSVQCLRTVPEKLMARLLKFSLVVEI